ncbi:MAG: ATP-binding cassette domain-containing protein [Coriobacteriales bacterium]|nr:ATP-binding cassette domain-containing protein [Coriobacteriales bacterium]
MSITFEQVSFSYGDAAPHVLDGIDFTVDDGSFTGIIGANGSGKSTLVQLADGLLLPSSGNVVVDGMNTRDKKRLRELRRRVGLVFQYPERQLFASTVADDVAYGPRALGLDAPDVEESVRRALELVGFDYDDVSERSPFALSGGQQRRVAIAGVLAMEPSYLVLDEPSAGMDPSAARELRALLEHLNDEGATIVMVSHDMDEVAELCTHVVALEQGKVALAGGVHEVFAPANRVRLVKMGLDLPRPLSFAIELAEGGLDLQSNPLTVDQLADAIARIART